MVKNRITATVDLNEEIKKTYLNTIFATKDSNAHQVDVFLYRDKAPVTLPYNAVVKGYFIRYSENVTAIMTGEFVGNRVSVTLEPGCYNKPGQFALVIKVTEGKETTTVFYGEGSMCVGQTDEIFYDDYIIMDAEKVLDHIKEMEEATADAREATSLLATESQKYITQMDAHHATLEASLESLGGDQVMLINDVGMETALSITAKGNEQVARVETAISEFTKDIEQRVDELSEEIAELKPLPGQSYDGTVISIEESAGKAINVSAETNEVAALVHQGKNFVPSYPVATRGTGITFTGNADGTITAHGTNPADDESWCWFIDHRYTGEPKRVFPPGKYTVSSTLPWGADRNVFVQRLNSAGAAEWWLNGIFSNSPKTFELTEPTVLMVSAMFIKGATVDVTFSVQIEMGDEVTAFEPQKRTVYNESYPVGLFSYEGTNILYDENGAMLTANVTTPKTDGGLQTAGAAADAAITGRKFQNVYAEIGARGKTPQEYGAIGNGYADDTAALQRCINENDTIYLPAGTYRITSPLILRSNIALIGHNRTVTTIKSENCDCVHFAEAAENGHIKGIAFIGDNSEHKTFLFAKNVQHWTFADIMVQKFGDTFFYANDIGYVGVLRFVNGHFTIGGKSCFEIICDATSQINSISIEGCEISFFNGNAIDINGVRTIVYNNTIQNCHNGINIEPSLKKGENNNGLSTMASMIMSNHFEGMRASCIRIAPYIDTEKDEFGYVNGLSIIGNYANMLPDGSSDAAVKFEPLGTNLYAYAQNAPHGDSMVRNILYSGNRFITHGGVLIDGGNILQSDTIIIADSEMSDRKNYIDTETTPYTLVNMANATVYSKYAFAKRTDCIRKAFIDGDAVVATDNVTLQPNATLYYDLDNAGIVNVSIPVEIMSAGTTDPTVSVFGHLRTGDVVNCYAGNVSGLYVTLGYMQFVSDTTSETQHPAKDFVRYEIVIASADNTVKISNPTVKYVW